MNVTMIHSTMGALNIPATAINVGILIKYNLNENLLCKYKLCKIIRTFKL